MRVWSAATLILMLFVWAAALARLLHDEYPRHDETSKNTDLFGFVFISAWLLIGIWLLGRA
jgi:hypothetical protein